MEEERSEWLEGGRKKVRVSGCKQRALSQENRQMLS